MNPPDIQRSVPSRPRDRDMMAESLRGVRTGLLAVCLLAGMTGCEDPVERAARERAEERLASYPQACDSVLGHAAELYVEERWDDVVAVASAWADVADDSLKALSASASAAAQVARNQAREAELVERARTVAASDTEENIAIYRELVELNPNEARYRSALDRYEAAARAEELRRREEEVRAARRRELAAKWSYNVSTDEMTGRKSRTALITSENTVRFGFPYEGAQHATLMLRTHPSYGRDVLFRIERGQLICRTYDRCRVRVRFDDGPPQTWSANPPADHSTTVLFLNSYDRFVQQLRRAQVVRIQPEVYQEGNPIFEFHVGGYDHARYTGG